MERMRNTTTMEEARNLQVAQHNRDFELVEIAYKALSTAEAIEKAREDNNMIQTRMSQSAAEANWHRGRWLHAYPTLDLSYQGPQHEAIPAAMK